MATARVQTSRPALKPTSREIRAPLVNWAQISWPMRVVPITNSALGGWWGRATRLVGSLLASKGANSAINTKVTTMTRPQAAFLLPSRILRMVGIRILFASCTQTGIQEDVEHVGQEVEAEHGDGHDEQLPLNERVVAGQNALIEGQAQAGIVEDNLGDEGATDDETKRHGEGGDAGQNGVAGAVVEDHPVAGEPLGLGHGDVILTQQVDHVVAHGDEKAAHLHHGQGADRHDGVGQDALDVLPAPVRRDLRTIGVANRQPFKTYPEQEQGKQGDHNRRNGLHHQSERGEEAVHPAAAIPCGEDADDGADGETQNGGGAYQKQGPADGAAQHVRDLLRIEAHRGAEIPGEDTLHIGKKLGADGAVDKAEGGLERFQCGGFHHGASAGKHHGYGIAWHGSG